LDGPTGEVEKGAQLNKIHMMGFTDIHTHILPGADDGAADMSEALKLVRLAWDNGTRAIFLTPHYRGRFMENTPQWHRENFEIFQEMVREEFPGMRLYLGSEVYCHTEAAEHLLEGKILSLNDSRYVLLEFSSAFRRPQVISGVSEITGSGFIPIIAHAERYEIFRTDASLIDEVLEMGALIQLNADDVLGKHGIQVKSFCHKLLKEQKAHFIASDAHDASNRPPMLRYCFLRIHKKYGAEYAAKLFYENAQKIIAP